jgi:hypothetical protein
VVFVVWNAKEEKEGPRKQHLVRTLQDLELWDRTCKHVRTGQGKERRELQ